MRQFCFIFSGSVVLAMGFLLSACVSEVQQAQKIQPAKQEQPVPATQQARKPTQANQANASELIRDAQRAVGIIVRTAKSVPALGLDEAKAKPFWDATKDLNENLAKAETGLTLKDNTFFSSLASANAAFAQAKIGLIMSGASNPSIDEPMELLSGIIKTLNQNFSKEAARLKQGGELTDAEKKKLDTLIAQQDELLAKLDTVEKNVAANNKEIKEGIKNIRDNSNKIKSSRYTPAGFVGGFFAAHLTYDLLWGWHWWWGPWGGWAPGFIDVNVVIWDDWVDVYAYDWALAEDYVDVADLEMDIIDIDDADMLASEAYLDDGNFSLLDSDLETMTSDLDYGWDDVSTDTGSQIMDSYNSNFDNSAIYESQVPIDTFQDYGMDDFGGGFGGGDFGGDFGGFDF